MLNLLYKTPLRINNFIVTHYGNRRINKKYNDLKKSFQLLHINNIENTVKCLVNSNKSLSRFGDGELRWVINAKNVPGFEKNSQSLRNCLRHVLTCDSKDLMIGLPDYFKGTNRFTSKSSSFWKRFCVKYANAFMILLSKKKQYYNTSASRPYMDYNTRRIANRTFNLWKRVWNNRNLLIVEGSESHLGVGNDLFKSANNIKRIECPYKDAFESYKKIFHYTIKFMSTHPTYIAVLAIGPTATILAYDLCKRGFRAIDVGHIDVEYEWYLMGAKEKIDLPHRYVNEVPKGHYSLPIKDINYTNEIIKNIP